MIEEAIEQEIKRKAALVRRLFATPLGKEVHEILVNQFDADDLRGETVEQTYYNLGQRDVLVYLRQLGEVDIDR